MKKTFLFLVTLLVNSIVQAQRACPTHIINTNNNGAIHRFALTNYVVQCPYFLDENNGDVSIYYTSTGNTAPNNYAIQDCSSSAGSSEAVPNAGATLIPLNAPISITFGEAPNVTTCSYRADGTLITLPVELMTFTAQPIEKRNALHWATASEVNSKGFQVERQNPTTDKWDIIGFVKAQGKAASYDFTDGNPLLLASSNTSYYRLRQIDNDGKETLSKVVSATTKGKQTLKVYPTLVSNGILTVDTEGGDYAIYNVFGQQVQNGKTTQRLDVSALAKGTYILKVGAEQAKFVKQ